MALWRVRVHVEDDPGRLAALAAAIADCAGNVLGLNVHHDDKRAVDEFFVEVPPDVTAARLVQALTDAGGAAPVAVRATMHELVDAATRALLIADRLSTDPESLPRLLAELLGASSAAWVPYAGRPAARISETAADATFPAWGGRAVQVHREGLPLTATEVARAAAMVRVARHRVAHRGGGHSPQSNPWPEVGGRSPEIRPPRPPKLFDAERLLVLVDGSEVTLRGARPDDGPLVRAMHARCSLESRYYRYFTAKPDLPDLVVDRLVEPPSGSSLVVTNAGGALVALVTLVGGSTPGTGELAVLVEDAWQGRRLGTLLVRRMLRHAREIGLAEVTAAALPGNRRILRIFERTDATSMEMGADGVICVRIPLTGTDVGAVPPFPAVSAKGAD